MTQKVVRGTLANIDFFVDKANLARGDPKLQGQTVGKRKRIRSILSWAIEHDLQNGRTLVTTLLNAVRANGGFRPESTNFVGGEAIANLTEAFRVEGYHLSGDGNLQPLTPDGLSEQEVTEVLSSYVHRAQQGAEDAALVLGTGKDLLESVAKHILWVKMRQTDVSSNFPMLLGQAFVQLDMKTPAHQPEPQEGVVADYDRTLYSLALALNRLRNKEGTGHGRLFLPSVTPAQARSTIQSAGVVADYMLKQLEAVK